MPCYDGRPPQTETEARINRAVNLLKDTLEVLGREVPLLVQSQWNNGYPNDRRIEPMLCDLLGSLTQEERDKLNLSGKHWVKDLNKWWVQHQIQDAVFAGKESPFPVQQQQMKDAAIKKLTRVEATLLGLTELWDLTNNYTPEQE